MLKKKHVLILASICCLTTTLFIAVGAGYDPWIDYDEDGDIDPNDLYMLAGEYGSSGDPAKNVTVMNWPTATNCLTTILSDVAEDVVVYPTILSTSEEVIGIGGKIVTFLGGGVSGGATFSVTGKNTAGGVGGGAPGDGWVIIHDSGGNVLARFALPLNSMFTVQNVNKITVYAEAALPLLSSVSLQYIASYAVRVVASVFWIEQ